LDPGSIFGEVAVIFKCPRTATVISQNYSTLAYLNERNFNELMEYSPPIAEGITARALRYGDSFTKFKIRLLQQVDYFRKDPTLPAHSANLKLDR